MASLQQYVPAVHSTTEETIPSTGDSAQVISFDKLMYAIKLIYFLQLKHDTFYQTLFGGDQLTMARA